MVNPHFLCDPKDKMVTYSYKQTGTGLAVATIGAMGSSVVTGMMLARS